MYRGRHFTWSETSGREKEADGKRRGHIKQTQEDLIRNPCSWRSEEKRRGRKECNERGKEKERKVKSPSRVCVKVGQARCKNRKKRRENGMK